MDGDTKRVMAVMGGWDWGWGWGAWLGMSVMMLLSLGLVIAAIVALSRYLGGTPHGGPPASSSDRQPPSAKELLDERLARGEIDEDEYTRRRQLLRAGR